MKRTLLVASLLFMGGLLRGLQGEQPPPEAAYEVRWTSALQLDTLTDIDERLASRWEYPLEVRRTRSPHQHGGVEKASMTNCLSYFDLTQKGFEATPIKYQQALGADCQALRALHHAVPAQQTYLADFRLDKASVNALPPDVGLIVSNEDAKKVRRANAKGQSWQEFASLSTVTVENDHTLLVGGDGWRVRLQIYAWGDFNKDGTEDVLMKTQGWLTEGTYEVVRLLLLTRTDKGKRLDLVKEYPLSR